MEALYLGDLHKIALYLWWELFDPLFNTGFDMRLSREQMEADSRSLEGARRRLAHARPQTVSREWFLELRATLDDRLTRLGFNIAQQLAEIESASPD